MNLLTQGYHYHAMWWRLCGDAAQVNLRVLQHLSEAGSKQVSQAAIPLVAFGVYVAKSKRSVQEPAAVPSALDRAKENVSKIDAEASKASAPCAATLQANSVVPEHRTGAI
jgi:hypothetical protein